METAIAYSMINRPEALQTALVDLAQAGSLALDLEMENHRHCYGLHVALIQISTPARNYIIDPLAPLDLKELGALLTNRNRELIIHDADFDQRACRQVYGWQLNNFFDTKIAAQLCGIRQFGLGHLLQAFLQIHTDKKFQRINWLKRPLPPAALDYAARDTASLHALKAILARRLTELGRLEWAREEFRRAEHGATTATSEPAHYRIKKSSTLTPRQLSVLAALVKFREQMARKLNVPVHFIMRNELLLQFAQVPPRTESAVRAVKGIHPLLYREPYGRRLCQAVADGLQAPEETHPCWQRRSPRPRAGWEDRLRAMQAWRRQHAARLDLEPHLLMANDVLQWCARHPGEPLAPEIAAQIRNWQKQWLWADFQKHFAVPDLAVSVKVLNK